MLWGSPSQSQTTFPRGPNCQFPRRGRLAQRSEPGGVSGPGFQDWLKDGFEDLPGEGVPSDLGGAAGAAGGGALLRLVFTSREVKSGGGTSYLDGLGRLE